MFAAFGFGEPEPDVRYFNALFGGRDILVGLLILKAVRDGDEDLALKANIACEATDSIALGHRAARARRLRPGDLRGPRVQRRRLAELAQRPAPPLTRFILRA